MLYANLSGSKDVKFLRNHHLPVTINVSQGNCGVYLRDGYVVVEDCNNTDKNLFMRGMYSDSEEVICKYLNIGRYKSDACVSDIIDTEENPCILVLTSNVGFFKNKKSYIKCLPVSEDLMLVSLIYGSCVYKNYVGDEMLLQRSDFDEVDMSPENIVYMSARELLDDLVFSDKETGYRLALDCVNAVVVYIDNFGNRSVRTVREHVEVFDTTGITQAKAKLEKAKAKHEQELKEREAAKEAYEKLRKEKEAAKLAAEEAAKKAKKPHTRKTVNVKKELGIEDTVEVSGNLPNSKRNAGAADFLSMLQNM